MITALVASCSVASVAGIAFTWLADGAYRFGDAMDAAARPFLDRTAGE